MTWALIARGDRGGLAAQTIELHRHLRPDKTLVMDLGDAGRGPTSLKAFTHGQVRVNMGAAMTDANLTWLLDDVDVLLTVEADYRTDLWDQAHLRGVRTVLIANPELYREYMTATTIICPTSWELDRMPPGTKHLSFPVARDRLPFRFRTEVRTFLHVAAPAMADRNGTMLLWEALQFVRQPCRMLVRGAARMPRNSGVVTVVSLDDDHEDYWGAYPDDVDVLLMPRRYGGLCLPVQECASLGVPAVMLDCAPQHDWPGVARVPAFAGRAQAMKGGLFSIYSADPMDLARMIDDLVLGGIEELSDDADTRARALDWELWRGAYEWIVETAGVRA